MMTSVPSQNSSTSDKNYCHDDNKKNNNSPIIITNKNSRTVQVASVTTTAAKTKTNTTKQTVEDDNVVIMIEKARESLRGALSHREASLTDVEMAFLSAMLFDDDGDAMISKEATISSTNASSCNVMDRGCNDDDNEASLLRNKVMIPSPVVAQNIKRACNVLNNDMLFSVPKNGISGATTENSSSCTNTESSSNSSTAENVDENAIISDRLELASGAEVMHHLPAATPRPSQKLLGLWQAHEDGVAPSKLREMIEKHHNNDFSASFRSLKSTSKNKQKRKKKTMMSSLRGKELPIQDFLKQQLEEDKRNKDTNDQQDEEENDEDACSSIQSDEEVRHEVRHEKQKKQQHQREEDPVQQEDNHDNDNDDTLSSAGSSWAEDAGGFEHYNTWEVLKDEYAIDFGFDYGEKGLSEEEIMDVDNRLQPIFRILGTNADDVESQPHVLSPPLMEALLNFVPDHLSDGSNNFWLKFSLLRDGASFDILKRYVRAAHDTILAIETTDGYVFGCYTSCAWRQHYGYYGTGPSFVWKMRHSRNTPCHSLFEQAQMESEIDVYTHTGQNDLLQICTSTKLAIGGGKLEPLEPQYVDQTNPNDNDNNNDDNDDGETNKTNITKKSHNFGFGICINEDLMNGTSTPCGTFRNPCLSSQNSDRDGEVFQIANLEIWTFTSAWDVKDAEKMEMTKFFMEESLASTMSSTDSNSSTAFGVDSNSSSNHYNSMMSSQDMFQKDFYRRVGEKDENATFRDRWHENYVYSR